MARLAAISSYGLLPPFAAPMPPFMDGMLSHAKMPFMVRWPLFQRRCLWFNGAIFGGSADILGGRRRSDVEKRYATNSVTCPLPNTIASLQVPRMLTLNGSGPTPLPPHAEARY
eukprot:888350-Rhodomonas_salina.2